MPQPQAISLQEAITLYLKYLVEVGKSPRTLYTYGQDCKQILSFFKPEKKLKNILPVHVAQFYQSDALLKIPRNGKSRASGTVQKTQRVFRMLLVWAKSQGYLETLPFPKKSLPKEAVVNP